MPSMRLHCSPFLSSRCPPSPSTLQPLPHISVVCTHTYLFNSTILAQYLLTRLAVLLLTILSLMKAYIPVVVVSLLVFLPSLSFYKRMEKKYGKRYFLE
ncbi:MAG: hypothetical protein U9N35_05845 [Euryarchaeota archaeon]|nr:hypothetical protein [Euryarchaeota archaeon]